MALELDALSGWRAGGTKGGANDKGRWEELSSEGGDLPSEIGAKPLARKFGES